jgi:predicted DCC family thiol-disulfide oxidoreductase YuxK
VFKFTTLQSEAGQELLLKFGLVTSNFDSIVLIDGFRVYQKSDAALEIIRKIDGFWKVFYIFKIIPAPLRNLFYDIVAQNRYRIFGRTKICQLPSPALKARFL